MFLNINKRNIQFRIKIEVLEYKSFYNIVAFRVNNNNKLEILEENQLD